MSALSPPLPLPPLTPPWRCHSDGDPRGEELPCDNGAGPLPPRGHGHGWGGGGTDTSGVGAVLPFSLVGRWPQERGVAVGHAKRREGGRNPRGTDTSGCGKGTEGGSEWVRAPPCGCARSVRRVGECREGGASRGSVTRVGLCRAWVGTRVGEWEPMWLNHPEWVSGSHAWGGGGAHLEVPRVGLRHEWVRGSPEWAGGSPEG